MTDALLEALWKKVVDHWEDEDVHGAFLEHCQSTEQLLEAAVRMTRILADGADCSAGGSGDGARGIRSRTSAGRIPGSDFSGTARGFVIAFAEGNIASTSRSKRIGRSPSLFESSPCCRNTR
jgi:hypothetical protein